jgi:Eukaryotic initiation factor 4E
MATATTVTMTTNSAEEEKPINSSSRTSTVEWVLWRHHCPIRVAEEEEWKVDMKETAHFFAHPTQEDFHADLNILPLPSKAFFLKTSINLETGKHEASLDKHTEYSLFKKGITPEWEDLQHNVGELYAKHYFPPELLDRYWLQLAHGVMEGTIDDAHVCGIRVVDKSKGKHPMYKLELWLDTSDSNIRAAIRQQALACVEQDEHYRFNFHWRDFRSSSSTWSCPSETASDTMAQSDTMAASTTTTTTSVL